MNLHNPARRDDMQQRFARIADQLGIPQSTDMTDLIHDDPDRSDVVEWLNTHLWRARAVPARDVRLQLGRDSTLPVEEDSAFATFVTAARQRVARAGVSKATGWASTGGATTCVSAAALGPAGASNREITYAEDRNPGQARSRPG